MPPKAILRAVLCVAFIDSWLVVGYCSTGIGPVDMTETSIGETHVRIYLYMKEHRIVPSDLSVLPDRQGYANRTTDGWGHKLLYSVDNKGIITLSSLGADGKPGGVGVNRDIVHRYATRRADGTLNIDDELWVIREIEKDAR